MAFVAFNLFTLNGFFYEGVFHNDNDKTTTDNVIVHFKKQEARSEPQSAPMPIMMPMCNVQRALDQRWYKIIWIDVAYRMFGMKLTDFFLNPTNRRITYRWIALVKRSILDSHIDQYSPPPEL
mmetsp:Transcript_21443/g.45331  ORF Transcript_21443/g.45331 Transcript_21443/m.45331 type:complete len:123 (+) Transcript_21443:2233-2601(+)